MQPARLICDAIRQKRLLQFRYHGLQRVVAPYCHGISTRNVEVLRAVQVRGGSRSGRLGSGKLWTVADIQEAEILSASFLPNDPEYNPDDSAMKEIHCRV